MKVLQDPFSILLCGSTEGGQNLRQHPVARFVTETIGSFRVKSRNLLTDSVSRGTEHLRYLGNAVALARSKTMWTLWDTRTAAVPHTVLSVEISHSSSSLTNHICAAPPVGI
jgi:hypothetical protein